MTTNECTGICSRQLGQIGRALVLTDGRIAEKMKWRDRRLGNCNKEIPAEAGSAVRADGDRKQTMGDP